MASSMSDLEAAVYASIGTTSLEAQRRFVSRSCARDMVSLLIGDGASAGGDDAAIDRLVAFFRTDLAAALEAELEVRSDIFGRERHGTHRDDLGGVGSFTDECRTLFIGGLPARATGKAGLLRTALQQQFGAWGTIASLRMRDGFAFVTYALRASAEFAREAMLNQSLGAPFDAVLNVRWASDDPNPRARQRQRAVAARAVVAAADAQQSQLQRLQHQNVLLGRQQRESEEQRAWRVWKQQGEAAPTPLAAADPGDAVGRGDRAGSSSDVLGLGGYSSSDASSDESP